jgi:prepilin-type N-terminal cleavage/methylation domain-containing protein
MGCRANQAGFTLVELMVAAVVLLGAVVASAGAISASSRFLQRDEQLAAVADIQRIALSYVRSQGYSLLANASTSSLTAGIASQLSATDWSSLGSTGSVTVTAISNPNNLLQIDLLVTYAKTQQATTSLRVAQEGISP